MEVYCTCFLLTNCIIKQRFRRESNLLAIPSAPVESLAEFEQMSGAFVSYPWGITLDMISELSKKIPFTLY